MRKRKPLSEESFHDESFELGELLKNLTRRVVFERVREERGQQEAQLHTEAFARVFETADQELRALDAAFKVRAFLPSPLLMPWQEHLDEALDHCVVAEQNFKRQLDLLGKVRFCGFLWSGDALRQSEEACKKQLEQIERRMADNTASAIGLGERLGTASSVRDSVEAGLEAMRYFSELNTGKASSAVFVDPERIHELESVLKSLRLIVAGEQRSCVLRS